jgi:hypothetical protein
VSNRRLYLILSLAAAILVLSQTCLRGSELDEFTRQDRLEHAAAGFCIGLGSAWVVDSLPATRHILKPTRYVLALIPVVVAGAAKEAYDHRHPDRHDCDARDFLATTSGGMLSATLVWRF